MSGFDLTPESEPTAVRRLEVISGDVGRRHWPNEVMARIVAESFASGSVVSVVARRHRLRPQQLFAWRRLAREGRLALPAGDGLEAVAFAPVVMAPRNADRVSVSTEAGGQVSSTVVRVGRGVDGTQLEAGSRCSEGSGMILPAGAFRVLVASKPVDFPKGMDGLAALVQEHLRLDPLAGL